jgi:hypothetical protein
VQVDSIKTRVESASGVGNQRLKLTCDGPKLNVAFNFNLRHYNLFAGLPSLDVGGGEMRMSAHAAFSYNNSRLALAGDVSINGTLLYKVGRCRLQLPKPELKARLVSALETKM